MMPGDVLLSNSIGGGRLASFSDNPRPSTASYHHHYPQPLQMQHQEEKNEEEEEEKDCTDLYMLRDDDGSKSLNCDEELGEEDANETAFAAETHPATVYQHQYGHGAVVPPHPLLSQQPPQPQQPQLCFAASHALPPFPAPMAVMAITGVPPTASVARPSIAPFHPSSSLRNVLPSGPPQQQHKPPPPTLPPPLPSRASLGRTQSMPALSHIPPPPPPHLLRQRSYSSLSRPYRTRTGYFLSQHLDSVDEADFEDVAEMVVNMHVQERDYYAPPLAYFKHLEQDLILAHRRQGSVRWFSKVVQQVQANRETIPTATNFLDRYLAALLYPPLAGPFATSATTTSTAAPAPAASAPAGPVGMTVAGTRSTAAETANSSNIDSSSSNSSSSPTTTPFFLCDERVFEKLAVCAFILAMKMQQGDSTSNVAKKLENLTSASLLTPGALCDMEFRMMGALGRYLNPPTAGTLIHHLLHFLPAHEGREGGRQSPASEGLGGRGDREGGRDGGVKNKGLFLALDDHANDLALMALDTPGLIKFPVSVIAVAAILASFAWVRSSMKGEGGREEGEGLDPTLEMQWLQTLDANELKVEPQEISDCLGLLGRQAKKAAAVPDGCGGWEGSIYLPHFLALPPSLLPPLEVGGKGGGAVPCTPSPSYGGKPVRVISPTGVEEIEIMEQQQRQQHQQQGERGAKVASSTFQKYDFALHQQQPQQHQHQHQHQHQQQQYHHHHLQRSHMQAEGRCGGGRGGGEEEMEMRPAVPHLQISRAHSQPFPCHSDLYQQQLQQQRHLQQQLLRKQQRDQDVYRLEQQHLQWQQQQQQQQQQYQQQQQQHWL